MKWIANLIWRYEVWKKVKLTERELYSLTDWELNDLGITRGDIPRIVREHACVLHRTERWKNELSDALRKDIQK